MYEKASKKYKILFQKDTCKDRQRWTAQRQKQWHIPKNKREIEIDREQGKELDNSREMK